MAKEKGFKLFTEAKAKKIQKRIAHYLRGHRKRLGITQKDFAQQLGYTELHYRKLESESPDNTIVKSLDTISFFGKLQNMTPVDFTSYIEQSPVETRKELFPWEKSLLEAFTCLSVESRMDFVHGLCAKTNQENAEVLQNAVDLAVKLNSLMDKNQIDKMLDFLTSFDK